MTLIPSKTKTNVFSTNNLGFGTMLLLLCVVMFGSKIIEKYVHVSFEIPAILYIVAIVVYLLYPNKLNNGKNGAQRILICIRYYFRKLRRSIAR